MDETIMPNDKQRLFVDIDGTLAEFRQVDTLEKLYEQNYFLNLKPHENVIEAIRNIKRNHPDIEVYILSSVLSDSKYALAEKNMWLDRYLPEITSEYRIFPPCGIDKKDFITGGIGSTDFLLDDYSMNLNAWEPPARGIKIMNGINGNHGTWQSERLGIDKSAEELSANIVAIIKNEKHFRDIGPGYEEEGWSIEDVTLSHDGYADVKIKVNEYRDGAMDTFTTEGRFRISDPDNRETMALMSVSDDIFLHPVLHRQWENIEAAIIEKIHYKEVMEAFEVILAEATEAIARQHSPWGSWYGRVVNNEKPEEYIDIELEGIERTSQLIINLSFVNGNDVVSLDGCDFYIDAQNRENLNYVKKSALLNMSDYISENLKNFSISEKGLTLYSPFTEKTLEEHYRLLNEKEIPSFPENRIYKNEDFCIQNHSRKGR